MSVARELQALLGSAENASALESHYARVIDQILEELAAGVSRPGAARARELLIRLRELATKLDPKKDNAVRKWIEKEFPKAYYLGDDAAARGINQAIDGAAAARQDLVPEPSGAFTALNQLQLKAQTAALTDRLSDVHRQILLRAGLVVRRTQLVFQQDAGARDSIVSGIIRGQTHREVANDIARTLLTGRVSPAAAERMNEAGFAGDLELFKQMAAGQMITVGKARMQVRSYVNLVARTMGAETHSVGMIVRLQQSGVDHVQVSRHQQDEADVCTPYAGQVFYVGAGEDPLGFPSIRTIPNGKPPWHPNCAHVLQPYVAALKPRESVADALDNVKRLTDRFFGRSTAEVNELVGSMGAAALKKIAPKGAADLRTPPKKGAA